MHSATWAPKAAEVWSGTKVQIAGPNLQVWGQVLLGGRFSRTGKMMIYCLININHRLTGPVPGRASPAVRGVLIWDTPIDVPRLKQVNWLVDYVAWEILLIWNLLYRIWKNYW